MKNFNKIAKIFTLAVTFIFLSTGAVTAQEKIKSFKDWNVYKMPAGGKSVYFIASLPVKEQGTYSKRSQPFTLVICRNKNVDEVNITSGYPYNKSKDVNVNIDNNKFDLFVDGEYAWAKNADTDKRLIASMKKGSRMVVGGTSWKNTTSQDSYSLSGFTAAYKHMKSVCQ